MSVSTIADQLRKTKALFGYVYSAAVPKLEEWLTDQLAKRIVAYGIDDIRQIGYGPHGFFNRETGEALIRGPHFYDHSSSYQHDNYVGEAQMWPWVTQEIFDVATSDEWFGVFYARFTDDGVPYFVVVLKKQQSMSEVFTEMLTLAFAAATIFVPGVGAVIAGSIFSAATIAAYPALTSIVTNTIVHSVLNGGDVEKAVQISVATYVGANVGSFVKGVSDSKALGTLASTATRAALTGSDMEKALTSAVINLAPGAVMDMAQGVTPAGPALSPIADPVKLPIDTAGTIMDDYGFGSDLTTFDAFADPWAVAPLAPPTFDVSASDLDVFGLNPWDDVSALPQFNIDDQSILVAESSLPPLADLAPYQYTIPTGGPMMEVPAVVVEPAGSAQPPSSPFDLNSAVKNVTFAMQSALQLVTAWNVAKNPGINVSARTTTANGSTVAASDSGLIQTRDSTGRVTSTKPAVGQPQMTTSGNVIVNNGDGTYTLISANGQRRVIAYPQTPIATIPGGAGSGFSLASLGLGNINATHIAIGIGAVGLLLNLSRKRR